MNCFPAAGILSFFTLPRAPLRIRLLVSVLALQIGST
jgi:hypothetical protein